jgi:uncharacterized protein (DUF2062 family)
LQNELASSWKPFLTGCFTLASITSLLGYFIINNVWRYMVLNRRSEKRINRR